MHRLEGTTDKGNQPQDACSRDRSETSQPRGKVCSPSKGCHSHPLAKTRLKRTGLAQPECGHLPEGPAEAVLHQFVEDFLTLLQLQTLPPRATLGLKYLAPEEAECQSLQKSRQDRERTKQNKTPKQKGSSFITSWGIKVG